MTYMHQKGGGGRNATCASIVGSTERIKKAQGVLRW